MFDQSFSAKNFHQILIDENRKGVNLEKRFFENGVFRDYSVPIKNINKKLIKSLKRFKLDDKKKRKPSEEVYARYKRILRFKKRELKRQKEEKLLVYLEGVSEKIQKSNFVFTLVSKKYKGKSIYTVDSKAETYFAMKQLQYNFQRLYKIQQANRFAIVNQVKCLLDDKFPKFIVRTDIKSFYESIDSQRIIDKINEGNLLSPMSKKFVKQILRSYEKCAGVETGSGIPRGIGISAYLAEYYMRSIDDSLRRLPDVTYYARYVDDIIVIFVPKHSYADVDYLAQVKELVGKFDLPLNESKTTGINLIQATNIVSVVDGGEFSSYHLHYLGYDFILTNNNKKKKIAPLQVTLTDEKIEKYKNRIKKSFESFELDRDSNRAYRNLKNRLKFLTGNTRLVNNKSNVLVGIYFSNVLITDPNTSLKQLDDYLKLYLDNNIKSEQRKEKLMKFSFVEGFKQKKFYTFDNNQLTRLSTIWKTM